MNTEDRDQMYCLLCHGRGLDQQDHTCRRCNGTGYEPDTLETGRGPAGCHCQALNLSTIQPVVPSYHPGRKHRSAREFDSPSGLPLQEQG